MKAERAKEILAQKVFIGNIEVPRGEAGEWDMSEDERREVRGYWLDMPPWTNFTDALRRIARIS